MSEEKPKEKPKGKTRDSCIYFVKSPLCIRATGQWIPAGVYADLSDCEDVMIRWLLQHGAIETGDGVPFNKVVGAVERKPCPCRQ